MCFASSIVESHKKLFIANPSECGSAAVASSRAISDKKRASSNYNSGSGLVDVATTKSTAKMSRSKSRLQAEVCGDCGASDPSWASINRGILLCSDCCSVHRSLGRHISIVKSLRQGTWEPSVLNFVNSLNAHGANSVWEHHLLDVATTNTKNAQRVRKPSPKDPVHPNKSDFIKAKHVNLSFVLKPNFQDDDNVSGGNLEQELSKQLHASVRTSNLETSLRLLVQGADPNYFHEEKRSTPLHVAAKFGQSSQIELLLVYGADINAFDGNNLTPLEVAKSNNHTVVAERLLDAMYEVTDRIIMFLGGKKPDHMTGRHLVIPDTGNNEISEQLKIARGRLHLVPNKMFEELVMDLYDEVDRRENEAIWATSTLNADTVAVPFLPANPFLSATRNQGRQKLARFSRDEFYGLLTDVLNDAHRRQKVANLNPLDPTATNTTNSFYNQNTSATNSTLYNMRGIKNNEHDANLSDDEPIYDPVASDDDYAALPPLAQQNSTTISPNRDSSIEMLNLRKQLSYYKCEVDQLKNVVQKLSSENSELKSKYSNKAIEWSTTSAKAASTTSVYDEPLRIDLNGSGDHDSHEPRSLPADTNITLRSISNASPQSSGSTSTSNSNQSTIKRPVSMYERRVASSLVAGGKPITTGLYSIPFSTVVKHHSDIVIARLKELVNAMKDVDSKATVSLNIHGERLRDAVLSFVSIFSSPPTETVRKMLGQLIDNNLLMQHDIENLQNSCNNDNKHEIGKYSDGVRSRLFHIGSAIKSIVLETENEN